MLISAKVPIMKNIWNHLEEQSTQGKSVAMASTPVQMAGHAWHRLLDGIVDNIHEIERAIQQSRLDRLLYELSQMRAQQETAVELERVRNRFGLTPIGGTSAWEVPNLVAAWVCVALSFAGIVLAYAPDRYVSTPQMRPVVHRLFLALSLSFLVCAIIPLVLRVLKDRIERGRHLKKTKGNEHHYEFDYHLDASIEKEQAEALRLGKMVPDIVEERNKDEQLRVYEARMASYRVELISQDEAIHKIHMEVKMRWEDKSKVSNIVVSVIYELLLHHPSATPHFVLRDVRAIALKGRALDMHGVEKLGDIIAIECINKFVSDADKIKIMPKSRRVNA
jgi:hypothetical protein